MTQRFGGLFSPLNQREMTEFYRAVDFSDMVDSMGSHLEEYQDEIKSLESQPLDMLIEIAEQAWYGINFTFFEHGGPGVSGLQGGHKEQGRSEEHTSGQIIYG